ncbi:hypothetical protein AAFF_G00305080 [Aldrovandia affinis]|uniref:Coiled-coil domain-containing protein 24 n=1 Tax=Aldrovandia affinis TaxID=143900 RepID=A0AAD7SP48_9TELE|nr:hypothetical protein AAFF_G00305080 [Aldrovandia affinis]
MACQPDDGNSDFLESYEPAPPAWYLLKEHVPESELPEIRSVLGGALVDLCTDTYSEVEMWVQIWKDVCSKRGGGPKPPRAPLADSPVVKELLKAEIRLLLLSLKEKAAEEGRSDEAVLSCYSPRVVNCAMRSGQRNPPQTADRRLDRQEAPSRPWSAKSLQVRSASGLSGSSGCEDDIDGVRHQLNVTHIDEVVAHLKSVLSEDLQAMKREIQFLQERVEQTHQSHRDELAQEPTVLELKEERKLIQSDLKRKESTHCPGPTGVLSSDCRLQGGFRSAGKAGVVWLDNRPHARPPRPLVRPSLPPVAMTHLPAHILGSSRHAHESSHHHGDEPPRSHRDSSEPGSIPEKRTAHPSTTPSCAVSMPAEPGALTGPCTNGGPLACSYTQGEWTRTSSPSLENSANRFPTGITQPLPPTQRQNCDVGVVTGSSISRLIPAPPATQKPTRRGQSVTRRLRLPQGGLVSPT